jgi:hypothetical protein
LKKRKIFMTRYTDIEKNVPAPSRNGKNYSDLNKSAKIAIAVAAMMIVVIGAFTIKSGIGTGSHRIVTASSDAHGSILALVPHAPFLPRATEVIATPLPHLSFSANRHDHQYKSSWCLSLHGWDLICTTREYQRD